MTFIKVISLQLHFETYLRYLNISMDQDLITVFPWIEAGYYLFFSPFLCGFYIIKGGFYLFFWSHCIAAVKIGMQLFQFECFFFQSEFSTWNVFSLCLTVKMEKRKSYELNFKLAVVERLADTILDEYEICLEKIYT